MDIEAKPDQNDEVLNRESQNRDFAPEGVWDAAHARSIDVDEVNGTLPEHFNEAAHERSVDVDDANGTIFEQHFNVAAHERSVDVDDVNKTLSEQLLNVANDENEIIDGADDMSAPSNNEPILISAYVTPTRSTGTQNGESKKLLIAALKAELETQTPQDIFNEFDHCKTIMVIATSESDVIIADHAGFFDYAQFVKVLKAKKTFAATPSTDLKYLFSIIPHEGTNSNKITFKDFEKFICDVGLEKRKDYELEWERAEVG